MESREGILVIGICDDDKSWVQTCKNTLMKFAAFINIDMEIKCFYTSKELLDYQDIPLDAVFLDIELGRQNGIMIAKKLNRIRPNCRIIYMTNYLHYATVWDEYHVKERFVEIIPQLSELDFSQCHSSYVVNFRHVKELQKDMYILYDESEKEQTVQISRRFVQKTREDFLKWSALFV
jgi:DNA-binding LytR/AlgR family response regulator